MDKNITGYCMDGHETDIGTKKIPLCLKVIKYVNMIILILGLLELVLYVFGIGDAVNIDYLQITLLLFTSYFTYYGFKKHKEWTVMMVLFTSWGYLLGRTAYFIGNKNNADINIIDLFVSFLAIIWYSNQIYIISKPEIRCIFGGDKESMTLL